jgi:hypothetical protein
MLTGPKSSSGWVNFERRYSKNAASCRLAQSALARRLFAVPGGPSSRT